MSKDTRLSIRMTADLDAWLEAEASARGLDKASFARMVLFERMNGRCVADPVHPSEADAPQSQTRAYSHTEIDRALEVLPDGFVPFQSHPQPEPAETDIEALVNQRVAEALARQPKAYGEGETGMHAHRRGGLPEYGGVANGGVPFKHQRHAVYGA